MKIDGKKIAQEILLELSQKVRKLKSTPCLAIILVGHDPASKAYVGQKILKAKEVGIRTIVLNYELGIKNYELLKTIDQLNNDSNIHGIIVQRPLPKHINSDLINNAISPAKDVDAFNPGSRFQSPIAKAVLRILEEIFMARPRRSRAYDLRGGFVQWLKTKEIVIIGKGETGGRSIIQVLRKIGVQPLIIDSKTPDPKRITKTADIIISAVGKEKIVTSDAIKKGVVLISIGLSKNAKGKLVGDYDEDDIKDKALFYTPTPGGVGPVNVACLLENLVIAAHNSN